MFNQKPPARRRPVSRTANVRPDLQYYRSDKVNTIKRNEVIDRRREGVLEHAKRLPLYFSLLTIAISIIYCSILGNKVTIILPKTGGLYSKEYYQQVANSILNESFFNHSKLTFDSRAFKNKLTELIPDATGATVSVPLIGRRPVVGLSLAQPLYVFRTINKQFIVGDNGAILAEKSSVEDVNKLEGLHIIQEDVPLKVAVGQTVLLASDIAFMQTVFTEVERAKLTINLVTLPLGANELYVHIDTLPYIVKFASSGDARQQVGAFLATKNYLQENTPSDYIDVRIGERVYVK